MANRVLIAQAAKASKYERNYIRYLVRIGFVKGEKHGGIWLVDPESLKAYEVRMASEGTKKSEPTRDKVQNESSAFFMTESVQA